MEINLKNSKFYILLTGIFLGLIFLVIMPYFSYINLSKEIKNLQIQKTEIKSRETALDKKIKKSINLKMKKEELNEKNIILFEKKSFSSPTELHEIISLIATKNNLKILAVSRIETSKIEFSGDIKNFKKISIPFAVSGNIKDIKKFIDDVDNSEKNISFIERTVNLKYPTKIIPKTLFDFNATGYLFSINSEDEDNPNSEVVNATYVILNDKIYFALNFSNGLRKVFTKNTSINYNNSTLNIEIKNKTISVFDENNENIFIKTIQTTTK